jgi:hypothetical protein
MFETAFYPQCMATTRVTVAQLQGAAKRLGGWQAPEGPLRDAAVDGLRSIGGDDTAAYAEAAGIMIGCHPAGDAQHARYQVAADLLLEAGGLAATDPAVGEWIAVGRERRTRTRAAMSAGDTYQRSFGRQDD